MVYYPLYCGMKTVFFTTPKPFNDANLIRQKNTLNSLSALNTEKEVVLFGDDDDAIAQGLCSELGVTFISEFRRGPGGKVPYINDIFQRAQNYVDADYYCYINADMVLLNDFVEAMNFINTEVMPRHREKKFFGCGCRWDTDSLDSSIDFKQSSDEEVRSRVKKGKLHAPCGIDYFIYQKGTFIDMPDFLIARQNFDCAITGYAIKKEHILEVDLTQAVFAIHQNHKFGNEDEIDNKPDLMIDSSIANEMQSNKGSCGGDWDTGAGRINGCHNYLHSSEVSPRFVFKKR